MEKKGVRVDVKRLEELDKTLDNKIKTLEKEIYKLAGVEFKIRSSKKLESVLFNKMKLRHKTGLNNLSGTNSKTLRMLERKGAEIAGKILRFRSLDKLKSGVKGCIDKVDEHDGRIHTDFLTTKTKTGRLSLKDPNLQSIPNRDEEARFIRQAFIAEEGHKLISADYSQMELRILAEIANVKKFKEAFSKGEDIHAITAKQVFGRDDGKFRQKAKAINFGIIYGMSEYQLAKELEVSTQEAKTYIEKYYKEYPEIEEYKRNTVVYGRVNHYVETFSGRRINTEYINSRIIPVKEHYRRVAVNARIQGTSADIMRLAMIKLSKELKEKNLGEIINTIHDELIVEAEDGKAEEVQKLMKEMMEKTAKEIIGVDVPVKINVGDDLNFGKELNEDQQETRDHLQENDDFTMSYDDLGYNSLLQEDEEETNDFINNYDLEEEEYRNSCFDILGIEYQVLVSMLCFHRAFSVHGKKYKNLSLATEEDQKKVGKYDDIVIRYIDKEDKKKAINVQVKRIDEEEGYNEIYCTTLFPQGEGKNKDMFAINKYFMSFLEQDKERRDETKYNVIFTNSDLATKDGKKVKYKLLKHSGIEVDEIRDEVLEDLLCANKEQPGFYNFSKGEVREKILKVIDPLQSESRKKVKRILEESTLSKIGIEKIEELLNSPSGKKEKEIKKLIEEVKEQLKPLEKVTKENVLVLLKPLFAAKKFTEKEYKKLIDDFFNKLVLAVNQPNRQELKMIVKKEIEEKIVENNDSSKVFNDFEKKMFGWLEKRIENEGIRITKENSGNYFREINKNADKGINTVTYREDKRYKKTPWVGAMVPRIVYIWELLTFYIYKAFLANKNDKDYEELSIKIGEKRTGENNYTCFNYKDKCTCISFEYKDIREGSREEIFTSIDDHYDYFLKLRKEKKKLEHFVVSVEGFELEEGCDFIGENELKRINFQGKGDHKLLENFFLCEGKEKEGSFYRFSEETIRKLLDKTDEEHKKEKKAFLEILVFKVNLPGREKLESSIQSEIGGEENYYNLKELVLRWIEGPMGMSIDNKIKEEYLKDIKDGKVSKLTYEMAEENKGLIGPIDSFVRTIVGRGEARRFRGFKAFLLNKGVDKFKALISNQALPHISSMLLGVREDCDSSFERLYDKLFDKKGKEKEFLKSFTSSGITLGNVSGMLHGAGSKAPEALETLIETLTKERTINGKNTTYLKFLKDKGILSNVSSMLGSAGSKAPEALETLIETLTKERTINGKNTTYLKFLKDKGILSNVSSMLGSAGSKAPEALETLIETLTKERTINGENTTYLKFLKDKGILSNVSSMLGSAGSKAPEALETLIETLTKERTINGKNTTYLKFLKDNGILSNVSGMLHGAGSKAPEALETLIETLTKERTINGENTTYLKFLKDNGILRNVSGMLHGAGSKAPEALETLIETLTKERTINGENTTYLKFLKDKGILRNVFGMLSRAGSQTHYLLRMFCDALNMKIDENNELTYLDAFLRDRVMQEVFRDLKEEKRLKNPDNLKEFFDLELEKLTTEEYTFITAKGASFALKKLCGALGREEDGGKKILEFFRKNNITVSISGMTTGITARKELLDTSQKMKEKLTEERTINGKNTTYLKFLKDKGILSNVSGMLHGAGSKAPETLETLIETLTKKINGKNTTYLKFLKDKGILSNVSSMLSRAGSQAPEALETLIETLTKERTINGKNTTYLKFLKDKGILSNVSGMLHGAGSKAPEALETLIETLTKERTINGKNTTYLKFLKDKGILSNVSGMLHGRSKAPEALEGSLDALNLKIDGQQGKKTYLECFSEKGITNEVIIGSLREWKKQRSEDYNKRFENYFDRRLKNLTEKNASSQENISSQQQSDKRKLKGSEESTAQNYSKKKKANTEVSSGCSDEERQEVVSCLSEFILNNLPDASVKSVRQGLYLPSFETRGVKINGKCTAITRSLSQALSLQNNKSFLSNLETSAEIYERIAQGKQISKREEREVFAFSKLLNNFERQLDSATNSLPSNLMHNKVYKTFSDLSRDIAEIKGNFAIHLVTSNHVVAIYRTGSNYAYFDSNVAFVSGLKSVDQLMKIVEKAVEFAGYEVGEKGFLVEYFDVEQANKLLSSEGKQILAKEIKTERQLLAEQDKELGLIKINGQEVSRVQLYDFGTKINVEGSVPLLINADMNLSSKKFQDHLGKKEVSMTAREYLGNLKDSKNVEEVVQATKFIPFIGSKCEIEEAKQTRKPKQSLLELAKGIINCILAAVSLTSASWSKSQLPEKAGNEPQTYLNDPTVDKQLQRSRQTISS